MFEANATSTDSLCEQSEHQPSPLEGITILRRLPGSNLVLNIFENENPSMFVRQNESGYKNQMRPHSADFHWIALTAAVRDPSSHGACMHHPHTPGPARMISFVSSPGDGHRAEGEGAAHTPPSNDIHPPPIPWHGSRAGEWDLW